MRIEKTAEGNIRRFFMVESEYYQLSENFAGLCLACGAEAEGVEPDAVRYLCRACDLWRVYGVDHLVIMGRIEIEESGESEVST